MGAKKIYDLEDELWFVHDYELLEDADNYEELLAVWGYLGEIIEEYNSDPDQFEKRHEIKGEII